MGPTALIIVPPFVGIERPSLAAHLLQAAAAEHGYEVDVLYANLTAARLVGEAAYQDICYQATRSLQGERLFAPLAFGTPSHEPLTATLETWLDALVERVARSSYDVVGCTSSYEQALASLAILERLKRRRPDVTTILGGANCEGIMAEGWASMSSIDVVFSGESELAFVELLRQLAHGRRPSTRVVHGAPLRDLDALPTPSYASYYAQFDETSRDTVIAREGCMQLPYETSRGCWWGQKHHCTFCGLNGEGMTFRAKAPDRVLRDLERLSAAHPTDRVTMVDNIMPNTYFKGLLPRLGALGLRVFYEQKANLTLDKVLRLATAGVREIQPGIEALSTDLLRLMKKGTTARQNVALLRYARAADVVVRWNLLHGFPNDRAEHYEQTLRLLPLLRHLQPPGGFHRLSIDRFSPYFDRPAEHGIERLRPLPVYEDLLPAGAPAATIAYHFIGEYEHAARSHPRLIEQVRAEVGRWIDAWSSPRSCPALVVMKLSARDYMLLDTRGLPGHRELELIDAPRARAALVGSSASADAVKWTLARGCGVELDGRFVPLAVATPELMIELGTTEDTEPDATLHRISSVHR